MQKSELGEFRGGRLLKPLKRPKVGPSPPGVPNGPSRMIRHHPLPLGYSSSIVHSSRSANSRTMILLNSSGVTSTITDE